MDDQDKRLRALWQRGLPTNMQRGCAYPFDIFLKMLDAWTDNVILSKEELQNMRKETLLEANQSLQLWCDRRGMDDVVRHLRAVEPFLSGPISEEMRVVEEMFVWIPHNLPTDRWEKFRLSRLWARFENVIRGYNRRTRGLDMPDVLVPEEKL
mgnify:FL=1